MKVSFMLPRACHLLWDRGVTKTFQVLGFQLPFHQKDTEPLSEKTYYPIIYDLDNCGVEDGLNEEIVALKSCLR